MLFIITEDLRNNTVQVKEIFGHNMLMQILRPRGKRNNKKISNTYFWINCEFRLN